MRLVWSVAAGFLAVVACVTAAAADPLPRVVGDVTYDSFPRLESYLRASAGKSVGLDLTIPLDNDETDGHLTTFVLDGQFELAYLKGKATRKIYVDGGEIELVGDTSYKVKGTYAVEKSDEAGEAPALYLPSSDTAEGTTFKDISIGNLPAKAGN